ncbi:MarR family winged helix-turn-helix transcriptional regulator [Neoroseomonas oryzicola]|uniref:Winged helix-turn-helix transcriptional regulator n=1 Tax=Neoroseomonas oryzicola TaxID=535904 RepID=A0A9X9WFE3_9PROT|nr:MarR family winged helix-turn-helix transcriptional regulator [Neoroseomonas oryzicola]MBR0659053.1 winged helix-turn-helix transcriptional regulator [Neoroseomonas oryzicola]NKE16990.1 winged helix-turn-helix transcriptional regulator [Neoroseomonas oryzicola]
MLRTDRCSCHGLRKATRHLTQFYDQRLAPVGLNIGQYALLAHLAARGPIGIGAFAATMAMDRTTLGRNLQPLERDGLLAIGPDPADRRSRLLALTPEGEARLAAARPLWRAAQEDLDARFGPERTQALRVMLAELLATDLA